MLLVHVALLVAPEISTYFNSDLHLLPCLWLWWCTECSTTWLCLALSRCMTLSDHNFHGDYNVHSDHNIFGDCYVNHPGSVCCSLFSESSFKMQQKLTPARWQVRLLCTTVTVVECPSASICGSVMPCLVPCLSKQTSRTYLRKA